MIFGALGTFAIEAIIEPGPEFPPTVGANVSGRIRVLIGDRVIGNFSEPCCVLGQISEHLTSIGDSKSLWHYSLVDRSYTEQFTVLDEIFFIGSNARAILQGALADCCFLTNVSEAFDSVKGFVLHPPGDELVFLFRIVDGNLLHYQVPVAIFTSAAAQFDAWLRDQERHLLRQHA